MVNNAKFISTYNFWPKKKKSQRTTDDAIFFPSDNSSYFYIDILGSEHFCKYSSIQNWHKRISDDEKKKFKTYPRLEDLKVC